MYDLNLASKNISIRPTWYKSYSFKAEYGLSHLSVKSLSKWLSIAVKNETLLNKYYKYDRNEIKVKLLNILKLYNILSMSLIIYFLL